MATVYDNPKGFKIIKASVTEFIDKCNFETSKDIILCDRCINRLKRDDIAYYVACLNMVLCKKCLDVFVNKSIPYEEDKDYEYRHFVTTCRLLGLETSEN